MLEIYLENFKTPKPNTYGVCYIPIVAGEPVGPGKWGVIDLPEGWEWTSVIALSVKEVISKIHQNMTICTNDPNIIRIMNNEDNNERIRFVRSEIEKMLEMWNLKLEIEQRGTRYQKELESLIELARKSIG